MSDRKKWGLASIITGVVFAAVGVIVYFTTSSPAWLLPALGIVEFITNAMGFSLLARPEPPA